MSGKINNLYPRGCQMSRSRLLSSLLPQLGSGSFQWIFSEYQGSTYDSIQLHMHDQLFTKQMLGIQKSLSALCRVIIILLVLFYSYMTAECLYLNHTLTENVYTTYTTTRWKKKTCITHKHLCQPLRTKEVAKRSNGLPLPSFLDQSDWNNTTAQGRDDHVGFKQTANTAAVMWMGSWIFWDDVPSFMKHKNYILDLHKWLVSFGTLIPFFFKNAMCETCVSPSIWCHFSQDLRDK